LRPCMQRYLCHASFASLSLHMSGGRRLTPTRRGATTRAERLARPALNAPADESVLLPAVLAVALRGAAALLRPAQPLEAQPIGGDHRPLPRGGVVRAGLARRLDPARGHRPQYVLGVDDRELPRGLEVPLGQSGVLAVEPRTGPLVRGDFGGREHEVVAVVGDRTPHTL